MVKPSPLAQRAIDRSRHGRRVHDGTLWRLRMDRVNDDLLFGPASDFAFDVMALRSDVQDAATKAKADASAHLAGLLGDWCESYGWPRDTPDRLRRAEQRERWTRSIDSINAAMGRLGRVAGDTTGRMREVAVAAAPAEHIRDLLARQAELEVQMRRNREAIAAILADSVLASRRPAE